jgi:hypothetical protein
MNSCVSAPPSLTSSPVPLQRLAGNAWGFDQGRKDVTESWRLNLKLNTQWREEILQLIVVYPVIYRVSTIQGGAGFLPSTVLSNVNRILREN